MYSCIRYGIPIYGMASSTNLDSLQILQNKLLKVLLNRPYRYSTNQLHNELDILKINDIFKQEVLNFVYCQMNNMLPDIFDEYFITFSNIHNIVIRGHSTQLQIPNHKLEIAAHTVKILGASLWNELSSNLKKCKTLKNFSLNYKKFILPYKT